MADTIKNQFGPIPSTSSLSIDGIEYNTEYVDTTHAQTHMYVFARGLLINYYYYNIITTIIINSRTRIMLGQVLKYTKTCIGNNSVFF